MIKLNGITLPDGLLWPNKTDYCPIKQQNHIAITGKTLLLRGRLIDGRPIHLVGNGHAWLSLAQVNAISQTRLTPALLTLDFHGELFNVRWDYSQADHFTAKHLHQNDADQSDDAEYTLETLKLIEVLD
ncbi:hypothetical protein CW745_13875 [Psychromonas sp. psych-6C06]|uniref:hypothetical protein n=1 Tax=Psychromonas sp. psych-6C06 TaxID=2058089 RepID=UPI000C3225E1|nr:hypothetical protein [Psychromonas sp. psych-6C06]PKF60615.1 hypothetical protein CW745_13875 [Psychromonas sp. psych-6C06]